MQMSIRERIKKDDNTGNHALPNTLNQLLKFQALILMKKEDISYEERKKALKYLMFEGMHRWKIKKRIHIKLYTSSTVSLEAMMIPCAINA